MERQIPLTLKSFQLEKKCYAEVLEIAKQAAENISLGDPTKEGDHLGPLFDKIQYDRVQTMIKVGIDIGNSKISSVVCLMVVESDESDGSFLKLPHEINIITNIDIEHLDYYKTKK